VAVLSIVASLKTLAIHPLMVMVLVLVLVLVMLRENGLFFEFSLCLSRACLGKMMHFIYKWQKKPVFLPATADDAWSDASAWQLCIGRESHRCRPHRRQQQLRVHLLHSMGASDQHTTVAP
jgi:hypothetical protein